MSIDDKLKELNIILPAAKPPVGAYVATKIIGKILIFLVKYLSMKMQNL